MPKVFRYCPFCAKELVRRRVSGRLRRACSSCGFVDYENARPTAAAVVVNEEGEVLLARRAVKPFRGIWNMPGGFLEKDEHPRDAALRELKEETGLEIEITDFIGIFMDKYNDPEQGFFHTINTYYAGKIKRGRLKASDDTSELKFFSFRRLPKVAFECDRRALEEFGRRQKKER